VTTTSMPTPDQIRHESRRYSLDDFAGTIRAFYPYWDMRYRPLLLHAVAALPRERFDFKPVPELLTAHQLVVHIAEAEEGWIRGIVEGQAMEDWVVPMEDARQGWRTLVDLPDHGALYAALEKSHRLTQAWLDKPVSELSRTITWKVPDGDRSAKLHYVLDHLQEHEIHHRAQLNLYLRLMGIEPPSI
jgi:uncharacterized damage-inducible protein DinB